MIKNLCNLSNENTHYSFILNYRGVGEDSLYSLYSLIYFF